MVWPKWLPESSWISLNSSVLILFAAPLTGNEANKIIHMEDKSRATNETRKGRTVTNFLATTIQFATLLTLSNFILFVRLLTLTPKCPAFTQFCDQLGLEPKTFWIATSQILLLLYIVQTSCILQTRNSIHQTQLSPSHLEQHRSSELTISYLPSPPTGIVCPTLTNPENGRVVYLVLDGNVPGTVANYSCNVGYKLLGNVSRECVRIGLGAEWTGEGPTCQRKCTWSASDGHTWCMQQ